MGATEAVTSAPGTETRRDESLRGASTRRHGHHVTRAATRPPRLRASWRPARGRRVPPPRAPPRGGAVPTPPPPPRFSRGPREADPPPPPPSRAGGGAASRPPPALGS